MNWFLRYKADHIIFWTLTVLFHAFTRSYLIEQAGAGEFMLELIIRNGLLALVIYWNLLVVIPRFTNKKNYLVSLSLILTSVAGYALAKNIRDVHLYGNVLGIMENKSFFYNTFYNISIVTFYLVFAVTLHFSKEWYLQRELIRKIEIEKLNTELEYLKAQINPHFLFNSINTIYFQIDKQNSSARETLGKFSEMLRYQLYECSGHEIAVEKEINYLKNYVELQRLRKDENYTIRFSSASDLVNFTLPPLLLLPFVENAFKHVSHFQHKENSIEITMKRTGNLFHFTVFNTKDDALERHTENGGIGLKNVKRRLALQYNNRHLLDINETHESFSVNLEIKLNP